MTKASTAAVKDVPITATKTQFKPLNWQIICEPIKPKETYGDSSIVMAKEAIETEQRIINCGKIIAMGKLACTEKTNNLDLAVDQADVVVGAYVLWHRYTGLRIKFKKPDGQRREFVALAATDLVMVMDEESTRMLEFWTGA